jgi:hypothetical protein
MSDISMCAGEGCNLKQYCYRYRAIPKPVNTYFKPYLTSPDHCGYFLPIVGQHVQDLDKCPKEEHEKN